MLECTYTWEVMYKCNNANVHFPAPRPCPCPRLACRGTWSGWASWKWEGWPPTTRRPRHRYVPLLPPPSPCATPSECLHLAPTPATSIRSRLWFARVFVYVFFLFFFLFFFFFCSHVPLSWYLTFFCLLAYASIYMFFFSFLLFFCLNEFNVTLGIL